MLHKRLIFFLILCWGVLKLYSVTPFPDFRFRHYTVEDGLSLNTVNYITQDSKGFMWIGTDNALNRYDGRNFKHYKPETAIAGLPGSNNILCIVENSDGKLWVGTNFGVYIFDPATEKFTSFTEQSGDGVQITSVVYSIIRDQAGDIWIATFGQGLFRCAASGARLERFNYNESAPRERSICSDRIRTIYQDSRGVIWILSFDKGISAYDPAMNTFTHYAGYGLSETNRYDVIFEDSRGKLWLGNYSMGISMLDGKTGEFRHYLTPQTSDGVLHVRCIAEYLPGILLIASDDGLTFFDTSTCRHETIKTNRFNSDGLNDNYLHDLFRDKEGGWWIGTYFGGINYTSSGYANFEYFSYTAGNNPLPGRVISVLCEDAQGNVWIGTDDAGMIHYDVHQETYTHYVPSRSRNSLSYHNIHALQVDDHYLWIGTYSHGLDRYDLKRNVFTNFMPDANPGSLAHSSVYALYKDKKGEIWVGTPGGLNKYDRIRNNFIHVKETDRFDVRCITEDERGYMWIASVNKGLLRYHAATQQWKQYRYDPDTPASLPSDIVRTITLDEKENLWLGTSGGGLCRYDYQKDCFESYADKGFPADLSVEKIIQVDEHLWMSTSKGLVRYNVQNNSLKIYNTSDGLQGLQFSQDCGFKARDGRLYFGGTNGFNRFNPRMMRENTLIPNVVISGFQLFNKEVVYGAKDSPLHISISYEDHIVLDYHKSVISFEFSSLSYMAPEKNLYAYKLEGFEKEWNPVSGEPKVTYTNLPPGDYVLTVKASNNDGLWNESGTSLKIKVLPPWWRSWYAYTAYVLLAVMSLIASVLYVRRKIMRQQQLKIKRIDIEKEKELYDAKITFFTHMIHEIRTPLSLIIGPLDYVLKSDRKISEVRDDLMVIKRNSNRLLTLVNQLMDFRKVESGNLMLKPSRVDVRALTVQIGERFQLAAQRRHIGFTVELMQEPCYLITDEEALTKTISNLLSNALKYTKDRIVFRADFDKASDSVLITVSDNGTGIPQEERDKIFKPFYQIRNNQPSDRMGTGVGLSLAKSLAELIGGRLLLENLPAGGAKFTICLPVNSGLEAENEEVAPMDMAGEFTADQGELHIDESMAGSRQPVVLAVDDNEEMRDFLFKQLSPYYRMLCAPGAAEAHKLLEEYQADLIISDVMMPDVDGFEFCNQVKNNIHTSHIPVILLTAKVDGESKIEGLAQGADVYFEKPFEIDHLRAQITALLASRERMRQRFATEASMPAAVIANSKADEQFLDKVDRFLNDNMADSDFSIADIAMHVGMSRSVFFAKLKAVSGMTPNDYVKLIRLKRAAALFAEGEARVNEVCFMVGFNSPSYFAKCFQKQFGQLPTDYIKELYGQ